MKKILVVLCTMLFIFVFTAQALAINIGNWTGSGRSWNHSNFTTIMNTMIGAGHTLEADGSISAANLANDGMFIIGEASLTPSSSELTDLMNWVTLGGLLLVFTNSNFSGGTGGNNILSGIGSSMSFTSSYTNATGPLQGGNFATTGPPYNIVGQNLGVSPGNIVSGGNVLYGVGLHYEAIGSGFVYAFGDRYDHNYFAPSGSNTNGQLFLNIAQNANAPIPEPATMLLLGSGLIGLAGFRRRFRKR